MSTLPRDNRDGQEAVKKAAAALRSLLAAIDSGQQQRVPEEDVQKIRKTLGDFVQSRNPSKPPAPK